MDFINKNNHKLSKSNSLFKPLLKTQSKINNHLKTNGISEYNMGESIEQMVGENNGYDTGSSLVGQVTAKRQNRQRRLLFHQE